MRCSILFATLALLTATPAAAQSLFGAQGLGLPVDPLDARARILGGIGTGLPGVNPSMVNPADEAGTLRRSVAAVFQPTAEQLSMAGQEDRVGATRFPLLRVIFPLTERLALTAGYAGVLDQSFGIVAERTEQLGDRTIDVRDILRSTGGMARAELSAAYQLHERFAIGLGAGVYTGEVQRRTVRVFPDSVVTLPAFESLRRWQYGGPNVTVGARWDPLDAVRVAGSLRWSGDVELESVGDDGRSEIPMPMVATAGVSVLVSTDLLAHAGGSWSSWSRADGMALPWQGTGAIQADDSWKMGGGLEWNGITARGRTVPVRIGGQYGQLPFLVDGEAPTEWSAGIGLGIRLAETGAGPGAVVDLALDRGARGDTGGSGLSGEFLRFTASLALFSR